MKKKKLGKTDKDAQIPGDWILHIRADHLSVLCVVLVFWSGS